LVVWLFGCLVVWLFGCLVVWLFGTELEKLRRISVPLYDSELERLADYKACEELAAILEENGESEESEESEEGSVKGEMTTEYLAALTYLLSKLAPHISRLAKIAFESNSSADPFDCEALRGTWASCPFPIRKYVFEQGLLKSTSRAEKDPIRLGFLWTLICRNQSERNAPPLLVLFSLFFQYHQSHSEKNVLLSRLRVISSRKTNEATLSRFCEAESPGAEYASFAFDNHQQAASMAGNARNIYRPSMINSVTRCARILPRLPLPYRVDGPGPLLSRFSFLSTAKEREHLDHANRSFFIYAATSLLERSKRGSSSRTTISPDILSQLIPDDEQNETQSAIAEPEVLVEDLSFPPSTQGAPEKSFPYPPLYQLPGNAEVQPGSALLKPKDVDQEFFPPDSAFHFDGKAHLEILPQLLGNSEDPDIIKTVLGEFVEKMNKMGQEKAFLMCDEKLFTLIHKMHREIPSYRRFILVLDPFHLGWNLEKVSSPFSFFFLFSLLHFFLVSSFFNNNFLKKILSFFKAIYSNFGECGLRELLASLGFLTDGQYSYIADCHDVRRSHHLLTEVGIAIESELFHLFLDANPVYALINASYSEFNSAFETWLSSIWPCFESWKNAKAKDTPR